MMTFHVLSFFYSLKCKHGTWRACTWCAGNGEFFGKTCNQCRGVGATRLDGKICDCVKLMRLGYAKKALTKKLELIESELLRINDGRKE